MTCTLYLKTDVSLWVIKQYWWLLYIQHDFHSPLVQRDLPDQVHPAEQKQCNIITIQNNYIQALSIGNKIPTAHLYAMIAFLTLWKENINLTKHWIKH